MLSARAYSIRKKAMLAISLSWVGGFTNVLTFLYCDTFTSHITGTSTNFGLLFRRRRIRANDRNRQAGGASFKVCAAIGD